MKRYKKLLSVDKYQPIYERILKIKRGLKILVQTNTFDSQNKYLIFYYVIYA